ncbi:TlpA family protein disulfide reductase [Bacillus sp. DNRA2]|uniref:peroxiredoxin family protein n=1 Tax=Bacillus sp. DNRA2 TaxID=2723053 RepID=UPI00145D2E1A|nr:TlpA disulfide reductase family protein [Bacillus sp. DNRA2]NMD70483.1 TlpA family protein disulfide reductase [Bacillus sp. DNRA2]
MIKKVIAAVVIVALFAVAMVQAMGKDDQDNSGKEVGFEIGNTPPDFELKTLAGDTVKLSDYKGKKVMLNFWATWCPPCKAEMPDMEKFYEGNKDRVEILAVNMDTTNDVEGFAKEYGITFPILLDEKNEVNRDYGIVSIPTTFFIDEKGVIKQKINGSMKLEDMEKNTK